MAEENEPNAGKKRRIIHWNPDAGREQVGRRWTWKRILAWGVGGFFGLLFAAGIVIRVAKLVWGPELFQPRPVAATRAETVEDANSAFITEAKAAQLHEIVSKSLRELRRMPTDHPTQLEQMVGIEKNFMEADILLKKHEFARSYALLLGLKKDVDAFGLNVKVKGEAKQSYDAILLRIKDLEIARSLAPGALDAAFVAAGAGNKLMSDGNFLGEEEGL